MNTHTYAGEYAISCSEYAAKYSILYYSTLSLTNKIAPFEGNNVGYSTLQRTLWQHVMTPGNSFASFECSVCACSTVQSMAQLS